MDKLLQLLSKNSQFTTGEIAAMLGEPEDYIKAQIKEYENQGIIKGYQAVVNWEWQRCAWLLRRSSPFILWRAHTTSR